MRKLLSLLLMLLPCVASLAGTKISELTNGPTIVSTDIIPINTNAAAGAPNTHTRAGSVSNIVSAGLGVAQNATNLSMFAPITYGWVQLNQYPGFSGQVYLNPTNGLQVLNKFGQPGLLSAGTLYGDGTGVTNVSDGASLTNIPLAAIAGGVGNLDTNAQAYANTLNLTDDARTRVNGLVRAMKRAGLWTSLNDAVLLRTNFNPQGATAAITLVKGLSATNHGTLLWDGAGVKTDGSTGWLNVPVSSLTSAFTVVVLYAGHTNAPGTADPFDLCNRSGTAAGEFSPRNNGNGEMRLALRCTAAEELSSVSTAGFPNGWFKLLQGFYYLECNDFRIHQVSVSYDNAGTAAGYVDNEQGLTATGFSTVITNGALNDLTLGCSRDASGNAQMFAKCNFAAAFVFNKVLSATEVSLLQLCYRQLEPFKVEIMIGDSETAFNFIGRNGEPGIGTDASTNTMNWWPAVALNGWQAFGWELGQPPYDQVRPVNVAISGTKAVTWDSTYLTNFLINFLPGKGPTTDARASTWLGINDLGGDVATAMTFYGHQTNIWWFFRTNAVRIRAFTLPAVGTPFNTAAVPAGYLNESLRAQYNSVIRSDPTKYNELIDLDLIMTTNNMATNASPLLSYDGLHPTIGGHLVIVSNLFTTFPAGFYQGRFNGSVPLTNEDTRRVFFDSSVGIGSTGAGSGTILSNDVTLGGFSFRDNSGNLQTLIVNSLSAGSGFVQSASLLNADGSLRMNTGYQLGTGKSVLFSSTSDANGSADVGLTRSSAGVLKVSDGAGGTGSLLAGAITGNGAAITAIPPAGLTFAATQRVAGRNTAAGGVGEEVTFSQFLDWVGSAAQGDILYRGASTWTRLAAGTSGQFLKTLGAGANPLWADASGGGGTGIDFESTQFVTNTTGVKLTMKSAALVTNQVNSGIVTLTDAATVATDASLGTTFKVTLGANRTLGNPTNAKNGERLTWEVIQDGTGGRTLAMDTKFAFGTDITGITLTTTASKRDFITAFYDLTADKFYVVGFVRGY